MKVKILNSSGWYKKNVGEEFEIEENTEYYDKDSNVRFESKNNGWIYHKDCVITELYGDFCVKRCDDKEKWNKYVNWLKKKYYRVITNSGEYTYYGRKNTMDSIGSSISFGIEIHIDDIIKHIDFYSEPMPIVENKEEFIKLNFNRDVKFRGFDGNVYKIPTDGNVGIKTFYYSDVIQTTARLVNENGIICDAEMVDIWREGVGFVEIVEEVGMGVDEIETDIQELIKLFPLLPTYYAEELVKEALNVKNGCLNDLSNFIGSEKTTPNNTYQIIYGNNQYMKADYVWRKIYDFKNKKEDKMENQKLSRKGLKEIHSVACTRWKEALEHYGTRNPLEDYIELSEQEVETMFKECTKEQLPIVSKYLKQDDGSIDLTNIKNDRSGFILNKQYIIRQDVIEYDKKSFWLNNDLNWEIKIVNNLPRLYPTKKK